MTNEQWIALLSFFVAALTLLSAFVPLAAYTDWFKLAAALVSAFIGYWFGVKPAVIAARAKKAARAKSTPTQPPLFRP